MRGQATVGKVSLSSDLNFAYSDNLGTVRARSNGEADTNWPFDAAAVIQNGVSQIHFTGKLSDTEDTLDYFAARYYEPNWGRFTTPDWSPTPEVVPYANLENPQTLNLYSYVLNNPVTATDPDGHICCFDWLKQAWGLVTGKGPEADENLQPGDGLPSWAVAPAGASLGSVALAGAEGGAVDIGTLGAPSGAFDIAPILVGAVGGAGIAVAITLYKRHTASGNSGQGDKTGAQDKKLTPGEIRKLEGAHYDVHEIKKRFGGGRADLYKDPQGNVYVKPKGSAGRGEPTGININHPL